MIKADPNAVAADINPEAAQTNPSAFNDKDGTPLTAAQFIAKATAGFSGESIDTNQLTATPQADFGKRMSLMRGVESAIRTAKQGDEMTRALSTATTRLSIADDLAAIKETGKGIGLTPDSVAQSANPALAQEYAAKRTQAQEFFAATTGLDKLTNDEIGQRIASLNDALPHPGQIGFADAAQVMTEAQQKASRILDLREQDPASAVASDPAVQSAQTALNRNDPKTIQALVDARIAAQKAFATPGGERPLTKVELLDLTAPLRNVPIDDPSFSKTVDTITSSVRNTYGRFAPMVLQQIAVRGGLGLDASQAFADEVYRATPTSRIGRVLDVDSDASRAQAATILGDDWREAGRSFFPDTAPSRNAIWFLRSRANDPDILRQFDEKYGKGMAQKVLSERARAVSLDDVGAATSPVPTTQPPDRPRQNVFDAPAFQEQYVTSSPVSLAQRLWLNLAAGRFRDTPEGAAGLAMAPKGTDSQGNLDVEASRAREQLQQYDLMRSSDSTLEYAVAATGSLLGQTLAPSSYLVAPVKWGSALLGGVKGRIVDAAIGNAIVSTALDPVTQGLNIAGGQQDEYNIDQTLLAPIAGAVIGGAVHGLGEGASHIIGGRAEDRQTLETEAKQSDPGPVDAELDAPRRAEEAATPVAASQDGEVALPADVAADTPRAIQDDGARETAQETPQALAEAAGLPGVTDATEQPRGAAASDEHLPAPDDGAASAAMAGNAIEDRDEVTKSVTPSSELPGIDRARWGWDGDEIADLARATAQSIEGHSEMPDLLPRLADDTYAMDRRIEPGAAPITNGATDVLTRSSEEAGSIDARIAPTNKAIATRPAMRGEVKAASGVKAPPGPIASVKPRRDILGALVNHLDSTVRQGIFGKGSKGALGTFNRKTGVVRTLNLDDADVVLHELGHDVHMRVIGDPLDRLVKQHADELRALDYDPAAMRPHEGFAEWLRIWGTNPAHATKAAPNFTAAVFNLLDKDYRPLATALRNYQRDMTAYRSAPSVARMAADVAEYARPRGLAKMLDDVQTRGLAQTIGGYFNAFYRTVVDRETFLRLGVRELLRVAAENEFKKTSKRVTFDLKVVDDAYKMKRMMSDVKSVGMMDLLHGVRAYHEVEPSTRSLSEAVATATGQATLLGKWDDGRVRDFGAYLIAKRGKWLYENRFATGEIERPPTAETLGDHNATIEDLEARYSSFKVGASIAHEFARGLLKKRFDGGLISREQFEHWSLEPYYVPFQRDMRNLRDDTLGGVAKPGTGHDLSRPDVKALKGSDRPIVNPVQSLIQQAFNVNMAIRQNDVVRALDRLATRAGPGSGAIAERIPNSRLKATVVDPIDALRDAAKRQGLSDVDAADLIDAAQDALGQDAFGVLFGSQKIQAAGKPIAFFWDGGQRHALQLADGDFGREMYHAIIGLPPAFGDVLTQVLAAPVHVFRAGVVTNPAFMFANFIRDQMAAWILTDGYKPGFDSIRGMGSELGQTDTAKLYNTACGISGGAMTAETQKARIDADINALAKRGWVLQRMTSLSGLFSVPELAETGTRIGVFRNAYRSAKKQGLSDFEALMEGGYIARDLIDFGRRGSGMVAAMRIIPFLNASIQSLDKATRVLVAPAARHLRGDTLTAQERTDLGSSMKAWAKISTLAVASTALAVVNSDNEEWQDAPSSLRSTAWLFRLPGGGWAAVPKPFELSVPGTIGERLVQYLKTDDPRQLGYMLDDIYNVTAPPEIMDSPVIKALTIATTGVDTFTGKPVVPDEMKGFEPWLQYDAGTSFLARDIGKVTGMPPLYIDQIISGFGASWGRDVASLYDTATGRRASQGWEDMVFTRRFIKDLSRGNTASRVFWDQISDTNGHFLAVDRTYQAMASGRADGDAADYLAKQPPEIKAFVTIKQAAFDADDRRMHPLIRAKDEIGVISTLRREMSADQQKDVLSGERIDMSPDQRRMADDVLTKLSYGEARNALVVAGDEGFKNRPIIDLHGDYETLKQISPALAAEFSNRLGNAKVADFDAVARVWPEAQRRLIEDGTQARLGDLRSEVRLAGYQSGGQHRTIHKKRIDVTGEAALEGAN